MKTTKTLVMVFLVVALIMALGLPVVSATDAENGDILLEAYRTSFDNIHFEEDIAENGFSVAETQAVMEDETDQLLAEGDMVLDGFSDDETQAVLEDETGQILAEEEMEAVYGQASAPIMLMMDHATLGMLKVIPAINREYNRLALFFISEDGAVAAKTDDFLSNSWLNGQIRQTNRDLISLSCADLNGDGWDDIIIISACRNDFGIYADKTYPVADVLFQDQEGFYRDPRVSDKINRFDMNKTDQAVIAFVRDGVSMEFLFTAKSLFELVAKGFRPIKSQCFTEHFEKFGVVDVVSGFFNMAGQNYLMVYIVDTDGGILWNFQPMHYYVNFYAINAISFRDIDGDGNKDLLLIGYYVTYDEDGLVIIKKDYDIYYQRAGYFLEDITFKQSYYCQEEDTISTITALARQYWGWRQ